MGSKTETRHSGEPSSPPPEDVEGGSVPSVAHAEPPHTGEDSHLPDIHLPDADNRVLDRPPYWRTGISDHGRGASYHSVGPQRPKPILLEDHSEEDHELSQGCWAKSATVDEYVLVSGATGIGVYTVFSPSIVSLGSLPYDAVGFIRDSCSTP